MFWNKEYIYHVVYEFQKGRTNGKGKIKMTLGSKLNNSEMIDSVAEYIQKENSFDNVIIINWIKIKK